MAAVIDAAEFEAARRDPELAAFIAKAEAYMSTDLAAPEKAWTACWLAYMAGRAR